VSVDFAELNRLNDLWRRKAKDVDKIDGDVEDVANEIAAEARSTAAGYPKGTGETARSIDVERRGDASYSVVASSRAAFYLEVGSPNTGAPRPFITGPAERALGELVERVGKRVSD
jgi:hypothetical protein